jgi:hypothetical protein
MAQTIEELQVQLAALQQENDVLKNAKKGGKTPILGSFKAKLRENGKTVEKKFGFKDGHILIRDRHANQYATEMVIKAANGEAFSEDEKKTYNVVALDKEKATDILQHLVDLQYAGLKVIE